MNPLVLKVGIPVAIIAVLAFMRWTNKKSMGEPFFPTSDSSSSGKTGGGAGSPPVLGKMNSPNEVQDNGTYDDGSFDYGTSDSGTTSNTTDQNIGAQNLGPGGGGTAAGHGALSITTGGVVAQPPAVQNTIIANTVTNPYTGGYQPYSPTPVTAPVSNQFGGQGGGGVFAL